MEQTTWRVVGHARIKQYVEARLAEGTFPHAVLCVGPEGVGKRALVRELAARLGAAPHAVLECDCATATVQEVREFIDRTSLRPAGEVQVAVLDHAEVLTVFMANSLLKTLEEPPAHTFFFLVSSQANALPTIASRCMQLRFGGLSASECAAVLGSAWNPALASVIEQLGPGVFVQDATYAARVTGWLSEWDVLARASDAGRMLAVQRLSGEEPLVLQQKIRVWLAQARMAAVDGQYARRIAVLQEALQRLARNANRKLVAEYVCLHI